MSTKNIMKSETDNLEEDCQEYDGYEDFNDTMCNMEDGSIDEYDLEATKSIASTIDDFIERTPVSRIDTFREKIREMQDSIIFRVILIVLCISLAISLFYWDETKQIIYTQYANIGSAIGFFRLSSNT
jgi:hypothetical protein